jgi:acyl-CoA synthetase (AMP-forming)/AMP-acid ligase II
LEYHHFEIEGTAMQVTSLIRQAAALNRDNIAVVTEDRVLTFAEAWDRGVRLANGLHALGVQPGDRVGGLEDNVLGCVDLYLACAVAGVVRVPLYPRNSREAHKAMLEGTDCVVLLCDEVYAKSVEGLEDELPRLSAIVVRDQGYEAWLAGQSDVDPLVEISDDDWFVIRHSGGTTGKPHGVGYTHSEWVLNCRNWAYGLERMHRGSACGHAGPISHASGYLFLPAWLAGAANVVFGAFEPGKVVRMMREQGVSHMFASPSLLAALARYPEAQTGEWDKLRSIMVGGAPITDATALEARAVFGDVLFQGYGQTEVVPLAMMGPEEWFAEVEGSTPMRAGGRVHPFAEVQIRDEEGNVLPIGEAGEIVGRVEGQMSGYWGDEKLSAERLIDGWVYTRDIGRLDHNGYLYVFDRVDDMIVSGGFNIWPAELETAIADLPGVLEVAVFGVPHERWGETPMAVVCVKPGAELTADRVVATCSERLGSYKKPTVVEFTTEALPKSVVGKLLRKQLREPHWAGQERRVSGA